MKKILFKISFFVVLTLLLFEFSAISFSASRSESKVYKKIIFEDKNFEKVVRETINKPFGDIYSEDVKNVKIITSKGNNINSIKGIENLINLRELYLPINNIVDISELKDLTLLEKIDLRKNKIKDIRSLKKLVKLVEVELSENSIRDVSSLRELNMLQNLMLKKNQITNVNCLKKLKNLKYLDLDNNKISRIDGRTYFNSLETLNLKNNNIKNLDSIVGFNNLEILNIKGNKISNFNINGLKNIKTFHLDGYNVKDLTSFKNLKKLESFVIMGFGTSSNIDFLKYETLMNKADEILKVVIKAKMSNYEKERAIHDYVVESASYDYAAVELKGGQDAYNSYGVLVDKSGVCASYAEAMALLLNRAGIECIVVIGEVGTVSHAWNIVKLEEEYYHLDATWDDAVTKISYNYFNITDNTMSEGRTWDRDNYPRCIDKKYELKFRK